MRRLTLGGMLAVLALFPAGTLAGTPRATVLSVDRHHHTLALVGADRLVHAYRYRGALPRLGVGDKVSFRRSGHTISHVIRTAPASGTLSFHAQVVRVGSGALRLRLADGTSLSLAAPLMRQIQGLVPGATVVIHETLNARRRWTVTITPPPSTTSRGTVASGEDPPADDRVAERTASGEVVAVSDGRLTLAGQTGADAVTIAGDQGLFDGILAGDEVDVAYHQSAAGPVADSVDDQSWGS